MTCTGLSSSTVTLVRRLSWRSTSLAEQLQPFDVKVPVISMAVRMLYEELFGSIDRGAKLLLRERQRAFPLCCAGSIDPAQYSASRRLRFQYQRHQCDGWTFKQHA